MIEILQHRHNPGSKLMLVNCSFRSDRLLVGLAYFAKKITSDFLEVSTPDQEFYYVKIPDECKNRSEPIIQVNTALELINYAS